MRRPTSPGLPAPPSCLQCSCKPRLTTNVSGVRHEAGTEACDRQQKPKNLLPSVLCSLVLFCFVFLTENKIGSQNKVSQSVLSPPVSLTLNCKMFTSAQGSRFSGMWAWGGTGGRVDTFSLVTHAGLFSTPPARQLPCFSCSETNCLVRKLPRPLLRLPAGFRLSQKFGEGALGRVLQLHRTPSNVHSRLIKIVSVSRT